MGQEFIFMVQTSYIMLHYFFVTIIVLLFLFVEAIDAEMCIEYDGVMTKWEKKKSKIIWHRENGRVK